jgi:hypothetical protein
MKPRNWLPRITHEHDGGIVVVPEESADPAHDRERRQGHVDTAGLIRKPGDGSQRQQEMPPARLCRGRRRLMALVTPRRNKAVSGYDDRGHGIEAHERHLLRSRRPPARRESDRNDLPEELPLVAETRSDRRGSR